MIRGALPSAPVQVRAPLLELFASIQGEGAYVGEPQLFLRLAGCPLRCAWCDTPESWPADPPRGGTFHAPGGARRVEPWMEAREVARLVEELDAGRGRTLSVTGGEPLSWPDFLLELGPALPGRRLHLETAGAHPETLARVADSFHHLSVDLKLPADMHPPVALESGGPSAPEPTPHGAGPWAEVRRRLLPLLRARDACGKLIVGGDRQAADYEPILDDVARYAPELVLYLQPVTPMRGVTAPSASLLDELQGLAASRALRVRILPQVHRLLGLR